MSSSRAYPIRPEVLAFESYTPGLSIDEIRERYGLDSVVKMASNENPLGTSPLAEEAIRAAAPLAFRYAQSGNPKLIKAIAAKHGIDPGHVVAGNGSDEIIDLLARVAPSPAYHNVVSSKPSFSMYKIVSRLCGVEFREVPLKEDFSFDWQGLTRAVDARTALVFITTPDNPSGYCPPAQEVEAFARALPPTCLLVIDEAYMDFVDDAACRSLLPKAASLPNVVFLRTFSKSYGLAGVRLGYGILPLPLADAMRRVHPPFSVNILAEEAGLAALADACFYEKTLEVVRSGRKFLSEGLRALGCTVYSSHANFLLFQPPASCGKSARAIFEALLAKGMIIRPLSSYGLEGHLRVSVGSEQEKHLFMHLVTEVLAG